MRRNQFMKIENCIKNDIKNKIFLINFFKWKNKYLKYNI